MKNEVIGWSIGALLVGGLIGYSIGMSGPAKPGDYSMMQGGSSQGAVAYSAKSMQLHADMRRLWSDHVIYTREYLEDAAAGHPVALTGKGEGPGDASAARLLKNQEDIGNAVAAYYGKDAGDKMTALLKDHIMIAVRLIEAARKGNKGAMDAENANWIKNASDISDFLSSANPNWPKADLQAMMSKHLSTTGDEVTATLKKDYPGSIKAFDAVYDHILMMSDALSDGIVKQFPDKF
jgi:hypothetical protein